MSIWTNLYTGTSGLRAHGDAIGVVGDNIANVSTTGYKASRAGFADIIGGRLGDNRLGAGVSLADVATRFGQGSLQQTGGAFDFAVRGRGFFALSGQNNGITGTYYSRDGRFSLDSDGYLVNPRALRLQGYLIDAQGTQSVQLGDLQIGALQAPPRATTQAEVTLNLDANATTPATFNILDPDNTSNYGTSITVYDSLGSAHRVNLYFRYDSATPQWEWFAAADGGELAGGTAGVLTQIGTGTLTFTSNGELNTQSGSPVTANWAGASAASIALNFGDDIASGGTGLAGTTQFAGSSSVSSVQQDGFGYGDLVDITTGDDGTITGAFSNGTRRAIARIALATFASEEGLERVGNQLFAETTASGQPLVDAAATGGRGSISAGSVEASNVDLATELVTMISYQRAFQANVRTVTTADEMLAEVANLKR